MSTPHIAALRDAHSAVYPADFSCEEARFAEELRGCFTFTRGVVPPLYAQTLLDDDADAALANPRTAPLTSASERELVRHVFSVLQGRATPVEAPVDQKDVCELRSRRSFC